MVIGGVALTIAAINLLGGIDLPGNPGKEDTASKTVDGLGSDDFTAREGEDSRTADIKSLHDLNTQVFGKPMSAARRHSFTMTVTTNAPLTWGYLWRDGKGARDLVTVDRGSISRTFTTVRPAALIGAQLTGAGGRVTCTVSVDGVQVSTNTANGPYRMAVCIG